MNLEFDSNPFVGLRPFESHESLLFFGRQEQTMELLERLHQHHFVAVVGNSGSGKSSLVRAGLLPRLKAGYLVNDSDQWMVSIMKPGQTPLCNLADALLREISTASNNITATGLEEKIKAEGVDAVLDILQPLSLNNTNYFLLVDQFEELFRFSLHQNDFNKKDEAKDFVNILLALAAQKHLPVYVVITMRSDFIGDCAQIYGLPEALNQSQYVVPRLNRLQLRNTIEGPVRLYNGRLNDTLTARLLNDVQLINDELPLLQHVLMRIWDYDETTDKNGELDLEDYKKVGTLEKALSNHADEALKGMKPEELRITRKIFQTLTAIDENGRKVRRPARLSELVNLTGCNDGELLPLINRFVEGNKSFLVASKIPDTQDWLIDISHESLIRQWSSLNEWVDEETESAKLFLRLIESAKLYKKGQGNLLRANELQTVLEWFSTFKPNNNWAHRYSIDSAEAFGFLTKSESEWKAEQKRNEKQQLQKRRNRRLVFAALVLFIVIISAFALMVYTNNEKNKKRLALNYWNSSQSAKLQGDLLASLYFTAEAISISNDDDLTRNMLTDGESFLPLAALENIYSFPSVVYSAVFHPNGRQIVLAGNDGTVRIINGETGDIISPIMMHEAPVSSAGFSANGRWLVTASNDRTARLWEGTTGKELLTLFHPASVITAAFHPDGTQLATACADSYVRLWNANDGMQIDSVEHSAAVTTVSYSSDGALLLTASNDSTARIWDLATKKETALFKHNGSVKSAVFNHDNTKILTASQDSTVRLWDRATQSLIMTLQLDCIVNAAVFSPDDRWIVTAGADGYARFWNTTGGEQTGAGMKHEGPVYNIAFSTNGKQLLTTGWDKTVRLWIMRHETSNDNEVILKHGDYVTAGFNTDGTKILSISNDSTVRLWDFVTKKQLAALRHQDAVTGGVFSNDGKQIATTCKDGLIRFWEVSNGNIKDSITVESPITHVFFSTDNKRIVFADARNNVYLWDYVQKKLIDSFTYHAAIKYAATKSIALSPNGKSVLIAGTDSSARVFDVDTKNQTAYLKHQDVVNSAVFSPDGRTIVTGCYDFTARCWNVVTQQQIGPVMKHNAGVKSAVFSPDGKWILTASWDMTTRLWDAATLQEIGVSHKKTESINSAVFSPDGRSILTGNGNGYIRLWKIAGDLDIPADLFELQAKALTGVELNLESGETQCMQPEQWKSIKQSYFEQGRDHFQKCKHASHNMWRRFYKEDSKTAHSAPNLSP